MNKGASKMDAGVALYAASPEHMARPLPNNFEKFLPWAFCQMQGDLSIIIMRTTQNEYVSVGRATERSKGKGKSKPVNGPGSDVISKEESVSWQILQPGSNTLNILATYDTSDNLVHIQFDKNPRVPRQVMKIIILIIKFYPYLTGLTINRGINAAVVHEIQRLLSMSSITDVCLDDTFVKEANYHILLETQNALKHLSLARCKIDDKVVRTIAENLSYPSLASKTLCILNLASNRISDVGAKYLAEALRSNRRLYYLNLSDNMITDVGAGSILDILLEFILTEDEVHKMRTRHMTYLKEKSVVMEKIVAELKVADMDRRVARKRPVKPSPVSMVKKVKGLEKEPSGKGLLDPNPRSLVNMELLWQEKANQMVEHVLGEFIDPFSSTNTFIMNDLLYCIGNNNLCYLNLAYNNLTYFGAKKILDVVRRQKVLDRKPRGLINVCIEGNSIPPACAELTKLDDILEMGLIALNRRMSVMKKKPQSKTSSK